MKAVFLPGMDGTGKLFEPIIRIWPTPEPSPLVIAYPSDRFLNYADLEAYVLPKLPTEPFLLIAESFGGPLAVKIASARPPLLKGLVLSATFVRQPRGVLGAWVDFLVGPYLFYQPFLNLIGRWAMKAQGLPEWQIDFLLKAIGHDRPGILAGRLKEALEVDALGELKDCRVPVLCLYAERDLVVARRCHELIAEALPNVRLVGLDTPHFLLQAKPAEALKEILLFARSLDPRA